MTGTELAETVLDRRALSDSSIPRDVYIEALEILVCELDAQLDAAEEDKKKADAVDDD